MLFSNTCLNRERDVTVQRAMGTVPDMELFSQENSDCVGWMRS